MDGSGSLEDKADYKATAKVTAIIWAVQKPRTEKAFLFNSGAVVAHSV
jgi:hypothetical protein